MIVYIPRSLLAGQNMRVGLPEMLRAARDTNMVFVNTQNMNAQHLALNGARIVPVDTHGFECETPAQARDYVLNTDMLNSSCDGVARDDDGQPIESCSGIAIPDQDKIFAPEFGQREMWCAARAYSYVEFFVSLDSPLVKAVEFYAPPNSRLVSNLLRSGSPHDVPLLTMPEPTRTLWQIRVFCGGARCTPVNVLDSSLLTAPSGEVWASGLHVFAPMIPPPVY